MSQNDPLEKYKFAPLTVLCSIGGNEIEDWILLASSSLYPPIRKSHQIHTVMFPVAT